MSRGDDFVTWLHTKSTKRDVNCVGSVGARNTSLNSKSPGPCLFKSIYVAPAYISRLGDYVVNGTIDLAFDRQILGVEINEWDFHRNFIRIVMVIEVRCDAQ